jgi:hypothetical protein
VEGWMASSVLRLRITGSPAAYTVSAEFGDKRESDTLAPLPDKLRENLQQLQEAMLLTTESLSNRAPVRERLINTQLAAAAAHVRGFTGGFADTKGIQEIGSRLFDCVFQPAVYKLYQNALEPALLHKDHQLHIKLCVEASELSYVPWETMFDKRGLFYLSCSQRTPFARATVQELDLHMYDKPPLRILCMVSAPKDFIGTCYELRTDVEQAALDQALKPLKTINQIKLCWTASGTQRELTTRIVNGDEGEKWDVFLFIGHGLEGKIALEEDGGTGYQLVPADTLRGILDADNGPKLVILNSCKGAIKPEDRLASTAETLVKGSGIAAVVAMQFDISDIMGTKFSPAFFSNLMLKVPIQRAMTLTRLDLQGAGFSEWISPVLYMQNKDGRVWQDAGAHAAGGA